MLRVSTCIAVLVLVFATGCRTAPVETTGTAVVPGDLLYGRLPADRPLEAFSFEGVEGSVLDFDVLADARNRSAPEVELIDPEGRALDLAAATESPTGAASLEVRGVVLLRNGIYKLNVRRPDGAGERWYRFQHRLHFPPVEEQAVTLSGTRVRPVRVSAPRGGLIVFHLKADSRYDVVPEIRAVTDPWGGRALDRSQVPTGAAPPSLSRTWRGEQILTFTAPRPGRYTILAAAKPGTAGVVRYSATVRPPAAAERIVYHPNTPPHYGVPGNQHALEPASGTHPGTGRASPVGSPPAPPPPPASAAPARVPAPPSIPLPPDPSLAQR